MKSICQINYSAASPNSGYAVRYRSPKPFAMLRASHTRKTLGDINENGYKLCKRNFDDIYKHVFLDTYWRLQDGKTQNN